MTKPATILLPALMFAAIASPIWAQTGPGWSQLAFAKIDTNADGAVTLAEITAHKTTRFATADADGNGLLDAGERAGARGNVAHFDANGDGNLTLAEVTARNPLFDLADQDGNGRVTEAEFAVLIAAR
jgi:Ca2+-binding EF-hand superfamily protein